MRHENWGLSLSGTRPKCFNQAKLYDEFLGPITKFGTAAEPDAPGSDGKTNVYRFMSLIFIHKKL